MKYHLIFVSGAVLFLSLADWTRGQESLASLKQDYTNQVAAIHAAWAQAGASCTNGYVAALARLADKSQKKGDFQALLSVNEEKARFLDKKSLPDSSTISSDTELDALKAKTVADHVEIDSTRLRKLVALADRYAATLDKMKKRLTVSGNIDSALLVKAELDRLSSDPELLEARNSVIQAESAAKVGPAGTNVAGRTTQGGSPRKAPQRGSKSRARRLPAEERAVLRNGNFEEGNLGWDFSKKMKVVPAPDVSTNNVLEVNLNNPREQVLSQKIRRRDWHSCIISFRLRAGPDYPRDVLPVQFRMAYRGGHTYADRDIPISQDWTDVTQGFTVLGNDDDMPFLIFFKTRGGTVWLDDLSITPKTD